jgi:hypothetical protein
MANEGGWYYVKAGQTVGPMSMEELRKAVAAGPEAGKTLVWGPGVPEWTEAKHVVSLGVGVPQAAVPPRAPKARRSDEIDYEIFGDDMQFVEITLDPGEVVVAEAGGMMYMTQGIEMQTVFGDPSKQQGFFGKMLDAGKRMVTGESLFLTTFGATSNKREQVAFAAPYPGKIVPLHLDELGGEIICQKDSFLCAARGVQVGIAFQKKILAGLFGGRHGQPAELASRRDAPARHRLPRRPSAERPIRHPDGGRNQERGLRRRGHLPGHAPRPGNDLGAIAALHPPGRSHHRQHAASRQRKG